MTMRDRVGLYGSYLFGMAGIGFTLPYLPLFLTQRGLSPSMVGWISTLAAVAGLVQFPVGLVSDRVRRRKPFLLAALALLVVATLLLRTARDRYWLAFLVVLFAENGACRATVESLAGAEATVLSGGARLGSALGALRLWKPVGVVVMALTGGVIAERWGLDAILALVAICQAGAVVFALLIREPRERASVAPSSSERTRGPSSGWWRDRTLGVFVIAMVLFHVANAPGGVYLGLFMKGELAASERHLSYAFVISNVVWMAAVWPAGRLGDRIGRHPVLVVGWLAMTVRLALVALAGSHREVLAIQVLDGLAQALFAVMAAAWVTDRMADPARTGTAQVLVGSSLVAGSAVGPAIASVLVASLGYRAMFGVLAAIGGAATLLVALAIPETLVRKRAIPRAAHGSA